MKNVFDVQIPADASYPSKNQKHLMNRLKALIEDADAMGQVITVEQVSIKPFAMGNIVTKASIRPARDVQGGK